MDLEHERRLTEVEVRVKKLEDEHEVLNKLATGLAVMGEKQDTMIGTVEKLAEKVDHIESKPSALVDKVTGSAIGILVGGFVAWLLSGAPGI